MHTLRKTSAQRMLGGRPKEIPSSLLTLQRVHTSLLIMITGRHFLLHGSPSASRRSMIHRLGAATRVGIDLHLGQKTKLGGRYTDITLIYISYLQVLCTSTFLFLSPSFVIPILLSLSKTQKDQKYFYCFSSFVSLVYFISLLYLLASLYYSKIHKILL